MNWCTNILKFLSNLHEYPSVPEGIEVLQPFNSGNIKVGEFYKKYYDDNGKRVFLIGINPGRFGAGTTGIPFTDPIRLEESCAISNDFPKKAELSSKFVYEVVERFGGPQSFFGNCFITSTSPLGFTKAGKNFNYYDDSNLLKTWVSFMVNKLKQQLSFGPHYPIAFSMGKGKNYQILSKLNQKYHLFDRIDHLPHPRWVMQYRLRKKEQFVNEYLVKIHDVLNAD